MSTATDPLSQLVRTAVLAALEDSGLPLTRRCLSLDQAAEYLGVSTDTLQRLHCAGKIQSVKLMDRKLLFDVRDLDEAIENNKHG